MLVCSVEFCEAVSFANAVVLMLFLPAKLLIDVRTVQELGWILAAIRVDADSPAVAADPADVRLDCEGTTAESEHAAWGCRVPMCDEVDCDDDGKADVGDWVITRFLLLFKGRFNCRMSAAGDVERPWSLSETSHSKIRVVVNWQELYTLILHFDFEKSA